MKAIVRDVAFGSQKVLPSGKMFHFGDTSRSIAEVTSKSFVEVTSKSVAEVTSESQS